MRDAISAQILIDPDTLATLRGGSSPDIAPMLERVAILLADVRARLENDGRVLVDQVEAGRLMSCSPKTLENHNCPCVKIGSRRMYRPAALAAWAAEHETAGELVEGAR